MTTNIKKFREKIEFEISFENKPLKVVCISLHIPYSKDTHHKIDSKIFKNEKYSFLNTARGKIVNEKHLIIALKTNKSRVQE